VNRQENQLQNSIFVSFKYLEDEIESYISALSLLKNCTHQLISTLNNKKCISKLLLKC